MENSLCNLVKLDINIPIVADIDTFLRAAPRLKYLQLKYSDIKVKKELYNSERFELQSFVLYISTITSDVIRFLSFHCRKLDTLSLVDTSVYGSFTRPGCQLIDMTYSRLQSLSLENTSFFIKDNKKCPENRNTTLITRPVDDIPPRQNYKFDVLPNFIGATPTEANHRSFRAHKFCGMICISKTRVSHSEKFFSDFEEFKKKAIERAAGSTKVNSYMKLNNSCAFGYTKIDLGYVVDCEIHLD
ncbi:hypothetical protein CLU79DRAFT_726915 [Phycomyces nitens]|nr:hypothetical protein CLU79DRAFT_726915 [Phycomyces nitens]